MTKPSIGYVGVGLMGLPMVKRLIERGYKVRAFDVVKEQTQAAAAAGASAATSPADAARDVDVVLLNLPTTDAVEIAVFGADGVASVVKKPQILIDFSTIKVGKGKIYSERLLKQTGCGWIDAPVSGGPPASATGTLTVMAGGSDADIAAATPLMKDVSARFTHMGPPGSGLVAKMINQLIVGCGHAVMAEALVLAESAGIDAKRIPECLAGGHADGTLLQTLYPRMLARDFKPQGYARQLLKDLEMVLEFSGELKAPIPMTGEALGLYRILVHRGHAELDTGAVLKVYEE
ncbi:MAG TPA: NAD(P)-dependent oxidoreductase [Pseudorhodoplanes sp.]|nr:NAD(P)-dependent oxidoreductase [Pseudorhodoplanes sp.]